MGQAGGGGEAMQNGTASAATTAEERQAAKFVNQNDLVTRLRMSASNSVGQHAFQVDGQRHMGVAPSTANIESSSNGGVSCGSLSQVGQPRSHQTGPSMKQQEVARSSVSSTMKGANGVGQFVSRQYDIFKGGSNGLPNLDYQGNGGNIQF